ncbi:GAF domain-containing protein [Hymenobacter lucidus]|uniref:GAF domain-containing protein n=1 Tax=Hymenobacter lucidus TaxID=2880930 RepID=A0ABS8ASJ7_9BACT|nr:GAF domain-containing protein [Hymenobacter lucidus]MCB2409064.1 GAF domain-containing protein [Hymenobacter lucidus]
MPLSQASLIPGNEEDRLLALSRYQIVGTAPESLFDEMTTLTAKLFGARIALISLVADDSVWFKANFGLPGATSVKRVESLCSVAILHNEATVFEDLRQRPCALIEPQVMQALHMNFYAAQPLQTPDGFNIGALCVIDHGARAFSADEQQLLKQLAATVMLLLELRRVGVTLLAAVGQPYPTIPALIHSLTLLAEIGSSGTAIDVNGSPVDSPAIYKEAGHLTELLNHTIMAILAD